MKKKPLEIWVHESTINSWVSMAVHAIYSDPTMKGYKLFREVKPKSKSKKVKK